jgi:putative hydrolase of the HAD superfamily
MTPALARPLRAVLFDLDDTLYPEHQFVDGGFRAVAAFLGPQVGAHPAALAKRLWELHDADGRGRLFDTLLAEHGIGDDPDLLAACVFAYRTHDGSMDAFPGALEVLDAARRAGLRTGVLSDGAAGVQRRKLEGITGLSARLDLVLFTDELGAGLGKPSPVPFRVACLVLGVETEAAAYVANDPRKDFIGARAAGLATIRTGRIPDEGGGREIGIDPAADADLHIDDLPTLAATLAAAAATGLAPATR